MQARRRAIDADRPTDPPAHRHTDRLSVRMTDRPTGRPGDRPSARSTHPSLRPPDRRTGRPHRPDIRRRCRGPPAPHRLALARALARAFATSCGRRPAGLATQRASPVDPRATKCRGAPACLRRSATHVGPAKRERRGTPRRHLRVRVCVCVQARLEAGSRAGGARAGLGRGTWGFVYRRATPRLAAHPPGKSEASCGSHRGSRWQRAVRRSRSPAAASLSMPPALPHARAQSSRSASATHRGAWVARQRAAEGGLSHRLATHQPSATPWRPPRRAPGWRMTPSGTRAPPAHAALGLAAPGLVAPRLGLRLCGVMCGGAAARNPSGGRPRPRRKQLAARERRTELADAETQRLSFFAVSFEKQARRSTALEFTPSS